MMGNGNGDGNGNGWLRCNLKLDKRPSVLKPQVRSTGTVTFFFSMPVRGTIEQFQVDVGDARTIEIQALRHLCRYGRSSAIVRYSR